MHYDIPSCPYDYAKKGHALIVWRNYGKEIYKFEPITVACIASTLFCSGSPEEKREFAKIRKLPKITDRLKVCAYSFPVHGGISFSRILGEQITKQIEEQIGMEKIYEIPEVRIYIQLFPLNGTFRTEDDFIFSDVENGICYTYFQIGISAYDTHHYPDHRLTEDIFCLLWIRCFDLKNPTRKIVPSEEDYIESLCFEICDSTPKQFPKFEDLPDYVHAIYKRYTTVPRYSFESDELYQEKVRFESQHNSTLAYMNGAYDATAWKEKLKAFLKKMIFNHENRKKMEQIILEMSQSVTKQKVKVVYTDDVETYYPDVTFHLKLKKEVSEEMVEYISYVMHDFNATVGGGGLSLIDVRKAEDHMVEVTVDFGPYPPSTMKRLLTQIKKKVPDLGSITVE